MPGWDGRWGAFVPCEACGYPDGLWLGGYETPDEAMDAAAGPAQRLPSGPTYFELTTAMAMLLFADRGVDAAVLEVGLGGRLDSTNVCHPQVTVITSISFEMEWPPRSGEVQTFPEAEEARWMPMAEARQLMLPSQLPILDALEAKLADG